ncbi:MAG: hypothetical protein M3082_11615 [Candidatus Dormibacteraeota bacterium]|nr:hypothetical protein [Candidatus Dormibacteraeota bacterium]
MSTVPRQASPIVERIANYHGMPPDKCWACGRHNKPERAHVVAHGLDGSDTDPTNYVLLCGPCHEQAPSVDDPTVMWDWIEQQQAQEMELFGALARELVKLGTPWASVAEVEAILGGLKYRVCVHGGGFISRATRKWLQDEFIRQIRDRRTS